MSQACQSDGSFGPGIGSCRGGFDFTLAFEDSILGLLPQAAFLVLAPLRLATLRRRQNRVAKKSHLGFLKLVTGGFYAFSSIVLLAIWSDTETFKTKLSIASAALQFLGSLAVITLSRLEHQRAVRPSHLLQFFLLILLLCEAVRLRTLFLMDYPTSLVTPASIHTFLTGLLLLLESLDKRDLFSSEHDRALPPEETIGLFGQWLFWHLNSLFRNGYRKLLKPADLYDIDTDLASRQRRVAFHKTWGRESHGKSKRPLIHTISKVLWFDILLPVVPRLIQMATTLSQPYLITAMITFIDTKADASETNVGYGLIAAFALNYTVQAIAGSWYQQSVARFSAKLRSCLITSIYEKTLHSTPKDANSGSATVLMNVDVEKVVTAVKSIHEFWAMIINVGVALYILYRHLGVAFVSPFITTLIITGVCTLIGKTMKRRQLLWVAATQRRVTAITYAASNIKGIRMLGLTETVLRMLTKLREFEVAAHAFFRRSLVWLILISNVIFQLTTAATYVTFAVIALTQSDGPVLNFNTLFGSLSALKLVTSPMTSTLQYIATLQAGMGSLERIEQFLRDKRLQTTHNSSSNDSNSFELRPIAHQSIEKQHDKPTVLAIKNGHFASEDAKPLLSNIGLEIPEGSFIMVVGRIGSGKSVLLRSLVGEMNITAGVFDRPSAGIAFCNQTAWLRNATIRANIIGEDEFEEPWYSTVAWACGLNQDFHELKRADLTPIGSRGISLSGGQKNRIALARALYSRRPFLVIDDMLTGLDNATEKRIFDRVFGSNGLLRKSGATVVLATHATHFTHNADRILVMSEGSIAAAGNYHELMARGFDFSQIHNGLNEDGIEDTKVSLPEPRFPSKATAICDDEDEDNTTRRSGDRKSFTFFLSAVGIFHAALYFGLMVISQAMTTIQYLWLKWWAESDNSSRTSTIRNLYLFIIITAINVAFYGIWIAQYALYFIPRSSLALHAKQLNALMVAKFSLLVSTDIGNITNRFSQDIGLVDGQLVNSWLNVTSQVLDIISQVGIMIVATPPLAATLPVLAAVGYAIQRVYLRTSRQVRLMDIEAKAPLCTHFLETLAGIVTIRSFGWSDAYRKKNEKYLDESQVPFYLLYAIQNWLNLVLELMVAGLVTVIVGLAVALKSHVDPGFLGLALVSAMDLGFSFRVIIIFWTEFETSLSAVTRIRQFSKMPSETTDADADFLLPESWPENGGIQFESLTASYSGRGDPVLHGINLDIKAGQKIGLCGRTGSGKSSFVATLFGLLHQQEGQITIDGIPTTQVTLADLRSKIIALPQEPFFLRGTVRNNLSTWLSEAKRPSVSDELMKDALEQVQLWSKLSNAAGRSETALDVNLDDVDSLLSQGERQLFCLARAILMDGKIVVLDEATSSVDAQTDALMQRILRTAFADRTMIAIAHRLDTILDFDRVVVMDAGRIAEVGPPDVLMKTDGSLFRALVETQGKK